jgi:hypothetical protein
LSKISPDEARQIRQEDPLAAKYLFKLVGSDEMINGKERYCLWLDGAEPSDLRNSHELTARVEAVRQMRLESTAASTRAAAEISHLFVQRAKLSTPYIAVPRVSSEARKYVPVDFFGPDVVPSDALSSVPDADEATFAVLTSRPFNIWIAAVSGRLKSDYRVGREITYNNFPLPALSETEHSQLVEFGKEILSNRANHPNSSLADLYGSRSMPLDLQQTHTANDKFVLALFGCKLNDSDERVLAALFQSYVALIG